MQKTEVHVKPAEGRTVPDPERRDVLPAEGRKVVRTPYWVRRIEDKDVVVVAAEKPAGRRSERSE